MRPQISMLGARVPITRDCRVRGRVIEKRLILANLPILAAVASCTWLLVCRPRARALSFSLKEARKSLF